MPTWSGIRKKLEQDYLCTALRGRIQYFATSYSKCPDHEGRSAIRLDGKEILKSSYYEYYIAASEAQQKIQALPCFDGKIHWKEVCQMALDNGDFDQSFFYSAFDEFDNQSIELSLKSSTPLVRVFALLDRRLGKRRLIALREKMENELEWVRFFYNLRMEAEGINMNEIKTYIENLKIQDVPWHRLTTPYGRATDFPKYFEDMDSNDISVASHAIQQIEWTIEHQNTLWHSTPFAMIFLARIFEQAIQNAEMSDVNYYIVENLLELFTCIAECYHMANSMEHACQLPNFWDMLSEEYLWSEEYDEMEDEEKFEEEGFPDNLFYSFYYYSYQVLLNYKPLFEKLKKFNDTKLEQKVADLKKLLI